jgi:4-hydroxybenzoate polyprenyltransferase
MPPDDLSSVRVGESPGLATAVAAAPARTIDLALTPLVVELDRALIRTSVLAEAANSFVGAQPLGLFQLLGWRARGRAVLANGLALSAPFDAAALPYDQELLAWLRQQHAKGRSIALASTGHWLLANRVAAHLGLFDDIIASVDGEALTPSARRTAVVTRYGEQGFDYVGNEAVEAQVRSAARQVHLVAAAREPGGQAGEGVARPWPAGTRPGAAASLLAAMRPHQWVKNLLVFIPLLAAHRYADAIALQLALLSFVAFGLTASSVYLLNDLVDVANDRRHARKRHRALAAGELQLKTGWLAWPALLALGLALSALALPWTFTACLGVYVAATAAYSLCLKQLPIVDVMTLAMLYTLRMVAGAAAIGVPLSFWLLSFSMFTFLSLALVKRYSELKAARSEGEGGLVRGRGYDAHDLELIATLGGSAGYTSVLVLALYVHDGSTAALYARPQLIWLTCPLLLFWVSRAWLIAQRGHMHDDPIVFALKDRTSWAVAALCGAAVMLARA